jgi:hypothetical protein
VAIFSYKASVEKGAPPRHSKETSYWRNTKWSSEAVALLLNMRPRCKSLPGKNMWGLFAQSVSNEKKEWNKIDTSSSNLSAATPKNRVLSVIGINRKRSNANIKDDKSTRNENYKAFLIVVDAQASCTQVKHFLSTYYSWVKRELPIFFISISMNLGELHSKGRGGGKITHTFSANANVLSVSAPPDPPPPRLLVTC